MNAGKQECLGLAGVIVIPGAHLNSLYKW